MIAVGLILFILGMLFSIGFLFWLGIILMVLGCFLEFGPRRKSRRRYW